MGERPQRRVSEEGAAESEEEGGRVRDEELMRRGDEGAQLADSGQSTRTPTTE